MVRLVYCIRRRRDLTLAEFHEHWLEHHVERYGRPQVAIRRYVLYTALESQPAVVGTEPYDGVASVWFDDDASLRRTLDSAMAEAAADELRFIDHDRARAMVTDDHVVVEPDAPAPVVLFECLARVPGATAEDFSRAWRAHGERLRDSHRAGLLSGYVQSHVRADPAGGTDRFDELGDPSERWDGVGAAYFPSAVMARRFVESVQGLPTGADADFVDHARTVAMLARRHPRRDPIR